MGAYPSGTKDFLSEVYGLLGWDKAALSGLTGEAIARAKDLDETRLDGENLAAALASIPLRVLKAIDEISTDRPADDCQGPDDDFDYEGLQSALQDELRGLTPAQASAAWTMASALYSWAFESVRSGEGKGDGEEDDAALYEYLRSVQDTKREFYRLVKGPKDYRREEDLDRLLRVAMSAAGVKSRESDVAETIESDLTYDLCMDAAMEVPGLMRSGMSRAEATAKVLDKNLDLVDRDISGEYWLTELCPDRACVLAAGKDVKNGMAIDAAMKALGIEDTKINRHDVEQASAGRSVYGELKEGKEMKNPMRLERGLLAESAAKKGASRLKEDDYYPRSEGWKVPTRPSGFDTWEVMSCCLSEAFTEYMNDGDDWYADSIEAFEPDEDGEYFVRFSNDPGPEGNSRSMTAYVDWRGKVVRTGTLSSHKGGTDVYVDPEFEEICKMKAERRKEMKEATEALHEADSPEAYARRYEMAKEKLAALKGRGCPRADARKIVMRTLRIKKDDMDGLMSTEWFKSLNESATRPDGVCVSATVYGGKVIDFTYEDVREMLADWETYRGADNLPKWIELSCGERPSSELARAVRNADGVRGFLEDALNGNPISVNVASDGGKNNGETSPIREAQQATGPYYYGVFKTVDGESKLVDFYKSGNKDSAEASAKREAKRRNADRDGDYVKFTVRQLPPKYRATEEFKERESDKAYSRSVSEIMDSMPRAREFDPSLTDKDLQALTRALIREVPRKDLVEWYWDWGKFEYESGGADETISAKSRTSCWSVKHVGAITLGDVRYEAEYTSYEVNGL